jgi:hypothetical protein
LGFLWGWVGGGWVAARRLRSIAVGSWIFMITKIVLGYVFRGAGGGEVSGGGTLYMKWGAGHLESTRVLKARAVRETHTHFYFTHLSPLTQLFSLLKIP